MLDELYAKTIKYWTASQGRSMSKILGVGGESEI